MKLKKPSIRSKAVSLSILLTLACLFGAASVAQAQMQCSKAHLANMPPVMGELRADFPHNNRYTVEVGNQPEISNQCQFGVCHWHSMRSELEHDYMNSHGGQKIKLSSYYITAALWLSRSLETLHSPDMNYKVDLGSDATLSRDFIVKTGLIPEEVWTGSTDFDQGEKAIRTQRYVENIIAQTKAALFQNKDPEMAKALLADATNQILSIFKPIIPPQSETFQYQGKTYTAQSFAKTFFPELEKPIITVFQNGLPSETQTILLSDRGDKNFAISTSIVNMEKVIRTLLDKGNDVFLGYDHDSTYVDLRTGIMSIAAFHMPEAAGPLPVAVRLGLFKMPFNGHAVQIVGYDLDPTTQRVIKWKIKNSWSDNVGDHGYFHMYADYFSAFVESISFFKTERIPLPKIDVAPMKDQRSRFVD